MADDVVIDLHRGDRGEPAALLVRPFVFRPAHTIPPRQFLYGRHYQRGQLSATIGVAGAGKTSFDIAEALAMVTGKPILGITPAERLRVGYWGEDPVEETERRIAAAILLHKLDGADVERGLHVGSAREMPFAVAATERGGAAIDQAAVDHIERTIRSARLDVLIVDPFVSSHGVAENDNGAIDLVAKTFVGIAHRCNCAIEFPHHPRKGPGGDDHEITVDDARGAGSLIAAVRAARLLNVMTKSEAADAGIAERYSYVSLSDGKANASRRSSAKRWFQLVGVPLGNDFLGLAGDEVAVITPWEKPGAFDGITPAQVFKVQERIAAGEWRENSQAGNWVGRAVAETLGLSITDKASAARIKTMLREWFKHGVLVVELRKDKNSDERPFVIAGKWVTP